MSEILKKIFLITLIVVLFILTVVEIVYFLDKIINADLPNWLKWYLIFS